MSAYRVRVDVQIDAEPYTGDRLRISDEVVIGAASFIELAGILGQFHELAERLRAPAGPAAAIGPAGEPSPGA